MRIRAILICVQLATPSSLALLAYPSSLPRLSFLILITLSVICARTAGPATASLSSKICTNSTHPTRWCTRNSFLLIRFRTVSVT